jgi:hypothetical protein
MMAEEAKELHRIISASVRDMLNEYRLQAHPGPVTDKALEEKGSEPMRRRLAVCKRPARREERC